MERPTRVHCFFEQSGTFKNEFIKLDIPAEDYDIQNNFGQTDHVVDLFAEINKAYCKRRSIFDGIGKDELIIAFFPCIHFCDAKTMLFRGCAIFQKKWPLEKIMRNNIKTNRERNKFYEVLLKFVAVVANRGGQLIIENPWNDSGATFLQNNFLPPTVIDKNRALRGDYYVKPTAYWFFGREPGNGQTYTPNNKPKIVYRQHGKKQQTGICDEQRSLISPQYAHNFIMDFVLNEPTKGTQMSLDLQLF